jgi:hypothetical protein
MTNLTQAQTELLTQVTAAPDGAIDAPEDAKLAKPLIKQGLLISVPKPEGGSRLLITDAGRIAIGVEPETAADSEPAGDTPPKPETQAEPMPSPKPAEPKGKLGALIALLKRPEGATIEAMVGATGWQAHSVRGAMSGSLKKKLGLTITSEKTEAGRIYRIEGKA